MPRHAPALLPASAGMLSGPCARSLPGRALRRAAHLDDALRSRSMASSAASTTSSNSVCSARKLGPLTCPCACVAWCMRSMRSASRALRITMTSARVYAGRSCFVWYIWASSLWTTCFMPARSIYHCLSQGESGIVNLLTILPGLWHNRPGDAPSMIKEPKDRHPGMTPPTDTAR
jgi:hypothetical protein